MLAVGRCCHEDRHLSNTVPWCRYPKIHHFPPAVHLGCSAQALLTPLPSPNDSFPPPLSLLSGTFL